MDERRPGAERDLFLSAAARAEADASTLPASSRDPSGGRGVTIGISMWLVAAVALVAGIIIGFASGFTAGQRVTTITVSGDSDSRSEAEEPRPTPTTAPPAQAAAGRAFTEGAVTDREERRQGVPVDREERRQGVPVDREERRQGVPVDRVRVDPDPTPAVPERAAEVRPAPARSEKVRAAPVEPVASRPGSIQILSRPSGAQVFVDGRVVGRTPLVIPDVRSGAHDVRLELPGFRRWATSVQVTPGNRTRVAASLEQ